MRLAPKYKSAICLLMIAAGVPMYDGCATQRLEKAVAATEVVPIDWSRFKAGLPSDTNAKLVGAILNHACQYALTTWWRNKYGAQKKAHYLNFHGVREHQIRPPAVQAMGLAIALKTGVYDAELTGVPRKLALKRTLKLIRSVAWQHRANHPGGWGRAWQSALWAGAAGTAGWLLWTNLPPPDQAGVIRMVRYEANRFTNYAVPYYRNRNGKLVTPGDTKAEENAWNASVLDLAVCMMPSDPNVKLWRRKALELTLSTYARPSDLERTNVYNGRPLSAWLKGSNANEDGTVLNHGRVHPDYMCAGLAEFQAAPFYQLAGQPVPRACFFNLAIGYRALVDLKFVAGQQPYWDGKTNLPPGGTIYCRNADGQPTGGLYFPQGNDWGSPHPMNVALVDCTMDAFGLDRLASIPARLWETQHDLFILKMQERFKDGHTFRNASEFSYPGCEAWITDRAARSYLTKWLGHQGPVVVTNN